MSNNDTYAKLIIDFQAKVDNMERNTARAASSLDKFTASAKSIGNMLTGGIFAAGIAGAVKGLASLALGAIETGDRIAKQSQRLSMSAKEYQVLSLAAQLCGQDIEMVSKMIDMSAKKIADASRGGAALEIFERLNVNPNDLMAMSTIDRIKTLSEAINALSNPVLRAEAHMKLFGKSGAQAAIFTRDFAAAVERAQKTVGEGLSQKQQVDIQELLDRYTELKTKIDQVKMSAVTGIFENLQNIGKADTSMLPEWMLEDFGKQKKSLSDLSREFVVKFAEMNNAKEDLRKGGMTEEAAEMLEKIETPAQKYADALSKINIMREEGVLKETEYKALSAEFRAEFERNNPMLAEAAKLAEDYADKLSILSRQLDAVAESAKNVPDKVTDSIASEAGAAMGKEAWTTIQGEQLYKSTDAARQYRMEMDALSKALESGRISQALFDQAAAYGEKQYNDARSAGMFSAIEGALNALEQNRINSTTEALQEMAQVRMDSLAAELQSVADAFNELQSFAQGEYFATRNPFEKYAAHMEKLDMADMFDMIDPETYMRSAMMAADEMDRALGLDKLPQMGSPFIAPPAAPGTAGFSTASQIAGVLAGAMAPANIAKQQLTEAQKTNMLLERSMYADRGIYL